MAQAKEVSVKVPEGVTLDDSLAQALAQEAFVMQLFAEGHISTGIAAKTLGISIAEFLSRTGRYHVAIFDENLDIDQEIANARELFRQKHS